MGKKPHECTICDYAASRKDILTRHINSVHEKKKPHQCQICFFATFHRFNLIQHISSVHEGKKSHQCTICDYVSSEKYQLRNHVCSVHEGKKPYQCSICDYTTSQNATTFVTLIMKKSHLAVATCEPYVLFNGFLLILSSSYFLFVVVSTCYSQNR